MTDPDVQRRALDAVKTATRTMERAAGNRERAIVEAVDAGASLRVVAKAAGITHVGVAKLVERVKASRS